MSLLGPFVKLTRALKEKGLKGTITQLYSIGDIKFGQLKGTDRFGNKYYEDLDLPYGQHRWVEYANIHNYDASMITPEWHGWMHHVFDETPMEAADMSNQSQFTAVASLSHAPYHTHLGLADGAEHQQFAQHDTSQYRQRGYKVGSLMTGPDDADMYYKQPSHPLSPDVTKFRFKEVKSVEEWDPTSVEPSKK